VIKDEIKFQKSGFKDFFIKKINNICEIKLYVYEILAHTSFDDCDFHLFFM
jgi:hypothetical protein